MIVSKTSLIAADFIAGMFLWLGCSALGGTPGCKAPQEGSDAAPLLEPPLAFVVAGAGRLQFYSAPDLRCAMPGVFVIGKDQLVGYAQTGDGKWTSVMYQQEGGGAVSGWLRSARLKETGTVRPKW